MSSVHGLGELDLALDALYARTEFAAGVIIKRSQLVMTGAVKKQLQKKGHKKGTLTDSLPGEPPSTISGNLQRSVVSDVPRVEGLATVGNVYPGIVYARIQELGGTAGHGNVLPARPYVKPGYDAGRDAVLRIAAEEWGRATRK